MGYFVNSSLCTRDYCEKRNCIVYRFHDLILMYARNHIPVVMSAGWTEKEVAAARADALCDKHRKLFYKYNGACGGKFELLPDDFYIHNFIGYHLSKGKLMADIKKLYDNSAFLDRRLICAGPEVVLVDILLMKKQHPTFAEQLERLEIEVKSKVKAGL